MEDEHEYEEFRKWEKKMGINPIRRSIISELIKIKKDIQKKLGFESLEWEYFNYIAFAGLEKFSIKEPNIFKKTFKRVSDEEDKHYT